MVNAVERLVRQLLEEKREYSINELAKETGTDYKTAHAAVQKLQQDATIAVQDLGNRHHVRMTGNLTRALLAVEQQRREELLKQNPFAAIARKLPKKPFYIALVFGSHARGKARKGSDIDLCIICDDSNLGKHIEDQLELLPLPLHILRFTAEEFRSMLVTNGENVGKHIKANNIILHGIENYYETAYG